LKVLLVEDSPEIIRRFCLAEFMLMRRRHSIVGRDHPDRPKKKPTEMAIAKGAVGQMDVPYRA
jgi:hypothetical protein